MGTDEINLAVLIALNILIIPLTWFILRIVIKPKTVQKPDITDEHSSLVINEEEKDETNTKNIRYIHEGESAGEYSKKWTSTYDLVFLILMVCFLIILSILTSIYIPSFWTEWKFWLKQIFAFIFIMFVVFCGGLLCRHYCQIDEHGYIITNRSSHFKVNYTKKIQHLAVHVIPLVISTHKSDHSILYNLISLTWSYYTVLLTNLILIKPLRERSTFLMTQFNSIDRPEDRPHTLMWVTLCNNVPTYAVTIFFRWLFNIYGFDMNAVFIFTLVNTVGDGLAEPVGIYFGKHRYKTRGCFNRTRYERSFEGSACVFISAVFFTSIFSFTFRSYLQIWITLLILPISMTVAEATSPHTCDSAFIHGVGGLIIFFVLLFV
ncbi:unnamed protein product [Adineta ricciae]|uniref:Dolichol kinase n=1 Tax=Adineta ricciae TaxID=249248 RepID=A0A815AZR0_ADIRI|nr:unnamed protein product [Adineta ricciae]CAF1265141.1 unnamed protein product [Adineta ricciae]